jgi:saccharopine dehydrogenase (NAD+, L-lysine-forming)
MKTILLLRGYGRIGSHVAHWLLRKTDAAVVVAGRHKEKADQLAARLNGEVPGQRVTAADADAANADSLRAAFRNVDLMLDCTSSVRNTEAIARAALAGGADYLDYHFSSKVLPTLRALAPDIERSGRCLITQAGFHPGLLAPLVRFVAPRLTPYHTAAVGMVMNFGSVPYSEESAADFAEEVGSCRSSVWIGGEWRKAGWRDRRKFDFGTGFGGWMCTPLEFEELHALPTQYGIRELGGYVAGFNWFVDGLVIPLSLLLAKVQRGLGARWLGRCWAWGMKTFARPPFGVVMRLDAEGEEAGEPVSVQVILRHPDIFEFTAIPVAAYVRQYLDGLIRRPGLWLMGEVVEPIRLFADMEQMGVGVVVAGGAARPGRERPEASRSVSAPAPVAD